MSYALWFHQRGIRVFPLHPPGPRGKEPNCASWDDYETTEAEIAKFVNYGVALGSLAVVDSDSPEVEAWVQANVPDTPFKVRTGRGVHRYYRKYGIAPHFIHRDGHTIEFRNDGEYVVGPGSIHPSGSIYLPDAWHWRLEDIPVFNIAEFRWDDREGARRGSADGEALVLPDRIYAGERHRLIFRLMRSMQARGVPYQGVLDSLYMENTLKCEPPLSKAELAKYIARVSKYKDRPGFESVGAGEMEDITLAGRLLLNVGMSREATMVAVKSINPTFDPDKVEAVLDNVVTEEELNEAMGYANAIIEDADALTHLHCLRCGHKWRSRVCSPKVCPDCHSSRWCTKASNNQGKRTDLIKLQEKSDEIKGCEGREGCELDEPLGESKLGGNSHNCRIEGKLLCLRCDHKWTPKKSSLPKNCPACRTQKWNVARDPDEEVYDEEIDESTVCTEEEYNEAMGITGDEDVYDEDEINNA